MIYRTRPTRSAPGLAHGDHDLNERFCLVKGGAILWRRKEGACDKELEGDKRFLLSMFLHPVGKCKSALFFLLASVFPMRFSLQRF